MGSAVLMEGPLPTKSSLSISRRAALVGGLAVISGFPTVLRARAEGSVLRMGSDSPLNDQHTLALVKFKEEVEARTQGRITVEIYPDAQLGGNEAMVNQMRGGTLDGLITDVGVLSQAVPEMDIFSMPFLYKDVAHAIRVAESPTGAELATKVEAGFNCHLLGWGSDGARNMFNGTRPISVPADVEGLKMRVQASPVHVKVYESLGALPTPVPFSELYGALQTGVVDGADVSVVDMLSVKLYQVTKYLSMTRHQVIVATTLISKRTMEGLSPEDQAIVREAGALGMKAQAKATIDKEKTSVAELKGLGIEVIEDLPKREEFSALMGPVYALGVERFGQTLLDNVKAIA